ncbi:MoxR family ATPase [Corallococcus exiguus]|uniref:AAA family ATPase n=1 Tax=Corallococcus exiguus TaxID=83462 RepID=UPI0014756E26|nr:MoxR family ATPase [Corallococcus exiguus]NNB99629.1 MoxR family ATPase [Corallococcus exiguus]
MDLNLDFAPKLFDPRRKPLRPSPAGLAREQVPLPKAGRVYVYTSDIVLAVNAALATRRPLLVMGPPGTGKSTLAQHIARHLGWRFYQRVITSRTQAQDLLWTFDAVRRLRDAQSGGRIRNDAAYVQPQLLWWALNPTSAARRGGAATKGIPRAKDPAEKAPERHAVVLLDEIDKADPDIPNDLLGPLGDEAFEVTDIQKVITREEDRRLLLVITSNDERELSPAFVRRCILLTLRPHGRERLVEIAEEHFPGKDTKLFTEIAVQVVEDRDRAAREGARPPSTAEYLDAVAACLRLGLRPDSPAWAGLSTLILSKFQSASPESEAF